MLQLATVKVTEKLKSFFCHLIRRSSNFYCYRYVLLHYIDYLEKFDASTITIFQYVIEMVKFSSILLYRSAVVMVVKLFEKRSACFYYLAM